MGITRLKYISIFVLMLGLSGLTISFGQSSQEEYYQSSPDKKDFNGNHWKKLKGKMIKESQGSSNGDFGNLENTQFDPSNFSTEEGLEGDSYQYESEEYKGEYSEYQNYENPENSNYEYDSETDNYSTEQNYYYEGNNYEQESYTQKEYFKEQTPPPPPKVDVDVDPPSTGSLSFMKVLAYILIIVIVGFLVYYFVMRYQEDQNTKVTEIPYEDRPPSEIPKTELERRLEEALARENYREAVRIYFIFIIKGLVEKRWINWERKKTNMSYLMEMRSKSQFDLFNETVNLYEFVWYGKYELNRANYREIEPKFKKLLSDIN